MQAMLDNIGPKLETGTKMLSQTVDAAGMPEGVYSAPLAAIAAQFPDLSIGSYPSFADGKFTNQIVVRSREATSLAAASAAVIAMLKQLHTDKTMI